MGRKQRNYSGAEYKRAHFGLQRRRLQRSLSHQHPHLKNSRSHVFLPPPSSGNSLSTCCLHNRPGKCSYTSLPRHFFKPFLLLQFSRMPATRPTPTPTSSTPPTPPTSTSFRRGARTTRTSTTASTDAPPPPSGTSPGTDPGTRRRTRSSSSPTAGQRSGTRCWRTTRKEGAKCARRTWTCLEHGSVG